MVDMYSICSLANMSGDHSNDMTLDSAVNITDSQECKFTSGISDSHCKPQVASQKSTWGGGGGGGGE